MEVVGSYSLLRRGRYSPVVSAEVSTVLLALVIASGSVLVEVVGWVLVLAMAGVCDVKFVE